MASDREIRALTMLSQEIGFDVKPWPGKKKLPGILGSYPDLSHSDYSAPNDGQEVWEWDDMAFYWGRIVPDGYFIVPQSKHMFLDWNPLCHHLCIVEVESTSRMSEDKMSRYGWIMDVVDGSDAWEFHLIIWDWYDQWREIELFRFLHRSLQFPHPENNPWHLKYFLEFLKNNPEVLSYGE